LYFLGTRDVPGVGVGESVMATPGGGQSPSGGKMNVFKLKIWIYCIQKYVNC